MRRYILAAMIGLSSLTFAQLPPRPLEEGPTGLGLLLRKLGNFHTMLHITAHPDDEDNALLVKLNRGDGARTALLSLTRGAGGQNQIGDEQGIALSILRTEELASMHRIDGAEQYFARAVDFGYSFSREETFEQWGREEILHDVVYFIRKLRPDVILCLPPRGAGGGQHHQASGILSLEAFHAAADANRFPQQIENGLHSWQPKKIYSRVFRWRRQPDGQEHKVIKVPTGIFDPLLGKTPYQYGREARRFHICQDMNRVSPLPGREYTDLYLEDTVLERPMPEARMFDGIPSSLFGYLLEREKEEHPSFKQLCDTYIQLVREAQSSFSIQNFWETIDPLHNCLSQVHTMIAYVNSSNLMLATQQTLLERLRYQQKTIEQALVLAHGIQLQAGANRSEVTPNSKFKVSLHAYNACPYPIKDIQFTLEVPEGWQAEINTQTETAFEPYHEVERVYDVTVPAGAVHRSVYWDYHSTASRYEWDQDALFGEPFVSPFLKAKCKFTYAGNDIAFSKPVVYRYENPWGVGEKAKEVSVLPDITLTVNPKVLVFADGSETEEKTVSVTVQSHRSDAFDAKVYLEVPDGWTVEPEMREVPFTAAERVQAVEFRIIPQDNYGTYSMNAIAEYKGNRYAESVRTIAYQHIQKRYHFTPSSAEVLVLPVETVDAHIGYVMGAGDHVPDALEQIGCRVTLLNESDVANENLDQYDLIMLGVRAYLTRNDLRKHNARILEYAHNGGTVIVQYNKYEFNDADWGPYPVQVSRNRVTDESAPVNILKPDHPLFNDPNKITRDDWNGWVQERGIYFLGNRDEKYVDLISSEDPFEYNPGEKKGILVETKYGKGRWLYCGLALFRQLPAGVPGAYKLLANLVGLSKQE